MRGKARRPARVLLWLAAGVAALAVLFYLFEFVVPKLLPENF
ncbi:MAG: hypothetical protein ACRDIF_05375 [Actinomycetota bacterium]